MSVCNKVKPEMPEMTNSKPAGNDNPAAPETPETPDHAPDLAALQAELDKARAQAADNLDKFMRAKAETENVRRRAETDVAGAHKFAVEKFALEMLAVKDSLERAKAVELPEGGAGLEKMLEGMDLTIKLMDSIFQKFAIAELSPVKGDKFNPEHHQAMSIQETTDVPDQHVLMPLQKGYLLSGRLLRPALVIVGKPPATP